MGLVPRCAVCNHPKRSELEEAARAEGGSLDGLVGVCERFGVPRVGVERHLAKCGAKKSRRSVGGPGPASERRAVAPSPPRELGGLEEELRLVARRLAAKLEEPEITAQAAGALSGRLMQTLKALEAHRASRPIHEHPEFDGLVEDLVEAVVEELGPKAQAGLEERIAARLEELQAARAGGGERRRAA